MSKASSIPPQLRRRGFGLYDGLALVVVFFILAWLAWRVGVDFRYSWDFRDIPQYLAYTDDSGQWHLGILSQGFMLTLRLSLWASALALIMGLMLALARLSTSLYARLVARTVVEVSRNIPPLVLVFIFFYFLSAQLLPWNKLEGWVVQSGPATVWLVEATTGQLRDLGVFFPAVFALALYEAAYFSEIFRGAIIALDRGQWEASYCLGLRRGQQFRYIILPQTLRNAAPQLAGQFISTVKESSIVSVVSLAELTYSGQQLATTTHRLFEVWLTVAALYFLFNFSLSLLFKRLEH